MDIGQPGPPGPAATGREIFLLDAAGNPAGGLPSGIRLLSGSVAVATRDGARMLKASTPTEFLVTLPEVLPADFTIEFDIVPKSCCNAEDLSFEGTATLSRSSGSARGLEPGRRECGRGGPMYQATMPGDLRESLPGQLTQIVASFSGETVKLYTNGRRLYTLTERRFARGRVIRVFLGGQDDGDQAVYLARLRVTAGAATTIASGQAATGTLVTRESSGTIKTAGAGTILTTATTTPTVAPRASAGAIAMGPQPAAPPPAPAPPPPPPPSPAGGPAAPMPPIGVGEGVGPVGASQRPVPEPEEDSPDRPDGEEHSHHRRSLLRGLHPKGRLGRGSGGGSDDERRDDQAPEHDQL